MKRGRLTKDPSPRRRLAIGIAMLVVGLVIFFVAYSMLTTGGPVWLALVLDFGALALMLGAAFVVRKPTPRNAASK